MTMPAAAERSLRECDECQKVDDLGHHQVVVPEDGGLRMYSRHFACCAQRGCPDGTCAQIILNGSPAGV